MRRSHPTLPMSIWVTGEPVPRAARNRGSFADMIRATIDDAWGGPWSEIDCREHHDDLPDPDEAAGIIVTGSPARIADQSDWMLQVQDGLRRAVEHGVPVFGICFGHQLLGMALGGKSGPNPLGREIGTVTIRTRCPDLLLGEAPRSFPVSMTHLDRVLELPPEAECLASSELDRYAAVRFGERAWGVQFHPEMDAQIMRDYVAALHEPLLAEGFDSGALLAACRDTPESAELLKRFALQVRLLSNADPLQYSRQLGVRV